MTINLGVKALLGWVNSIKVSEREVTVDDLQDGTVFQKVIYMLKKETDLCFNHSTEDRFNLIGDFVKRDCRFSAAKGTSISWDNIRDGTNLTVEVAKVLLLLIYYDMMNDRCTLNMLECDVEREIANLTASFVLESEGSVYLSNRLDAYLAKRHLPVSREIFDRSVSTSTSITSTTSSLSDDESPIFHRTQKITFVDMQTVASSSVSRSPLQDIMNTPKFQMRKMQRQMIKERDYRDGLERELACKLALIAQKESHINQLQYRLDKMKEERGECEQVAREQINDLENKNNSLQMRFNEILKQNKDLKSTSSLMERKVDDLTEENGILSSQVRTFSSQLAVSEMEVSRLRETHASAQEEWQIEVNQLQSELNQATAQKELLTEQIQILQGKISYLEDEISKATKEEVGENMGPVMEREILESEINSLKNELEMTSFSLKTAEEEIEAKAHQLVEFQQEMFEQKELLKQQKSQTKEIIEAKDEIMDKLQKEITEQRAVLQQQIQDLKLKLEQAEQQKIEQMSRLQQHVVAYEQEVEKLKEAKKAKEDLLHQTEEKVNDLEIKLSAAYSLLANKDQQINGLKEEVHVLTDETIKIKNEIQAKEAMLAKLHLDKSKEQEILHNEIQSLKTQVMELNSSLKLAEQEIQIKQDILAKAQQENIQQRELLQQQVVTCEEEVQKLNAAIQVKTEQLVLLTNESTQNSESLEQEIKDLRGQVESLTESLKKSDEQVQTQLVLINNQEQESFHQKEHLQQQLADYEDRERSMREEIHAREEQINLLKCQSSEQSELLHQEIRDLNKKVEGLCFSLRSTEENLLSMECMFAKQQLQNSQHTEALQASQDEVKRLNADIHVKEEQLVQLKIETSTHTELLQQEIEGLNKQIESLSISIEFVKGQIQIKENLSAKQHEESTLQIEALKKHSAALEEEVNQLRQQIKIKEGEVDTLKNESYKESQKFLKEIQSLRDQVESLSESLNTATDQVQNKENLLAQRELEISQGKDKFQKMLTTSEEEKRGLREQLQVKEVQLATLKREGATHSDILQQEIADLKNQLNNLTDSLTQAEQKVQNQLLLLNKQEQESRDEKESLQQQLCASEDQVQRMREEIQAKEVELDTFKVESCNASQVIQNEIQTLRDQVESLSESLKTSIVQVQDKDNEKEHLQQQLSASENQVQRMKEEIQAKKGELDTVKAESYKKSQELQNEIQTLRDQLGSLSESLKTSTEQVRDRENLLAQREVEISQGKDELQKMLTSSEEKIRCLGEQIQAKEEELDKLKKEGATQSVMLQQEITGLKNQLDSVTESLTKAQEKVQIQMVLHDKQEQENFHQKELLQQELFVMREELQSKEKQMILVKTESLEKANLLNQEILSLKNQVEILCSSLNKADERMQSKEDLLAQKEVDIQKLKQCDSEKQSLLLKTEEKLEVLRAELSAVNKLVANKDQTLNTLREELAAKAYLVHEARQEAEGKENILAAMKEENSKLTDVLQCEIQDLREQVENISLKLVAKEQMSLKTEQESSLKIDTLQQQLMSVNAELNHHKKTHAADVRLQEDAQELQIATQREKEALVQEKEVLLAKLHQAENDHKALEEQLKAMVCEKERLAQAKRATERENAASQKLESALQYELEVLKMDKENLLKEIEKAQEIEAQKRDLQQQLLAKTEAVEHYKAQMEKAVNHYNGKKQLLQESQQEVAELKHSLEVKESEIKAFTAENKLLQRELEKAQTNEKKLLHSLKAQLVLADRNLQVQNKIHGKEGRTTEACCLDVSNKNSTIQTKVKRTMSSDSLDQSALEDSLNGTRKLSAPDESSTPLVRSSERLAGKRRGLQAESLETLYFTPINTRHVNRSSTENKMELDSARKNPSSSVKRRRTTQVINITMTKKTPGANEGDESFYSLASARSQPNLSSAHSAQPVSMELFSTPAKMTNAASDQLLGLPGYRRSTIHSQTTSTFCVGEENEPEGAPEDWMRIAELQARNKACPPHLKSSYPVESETGHGGVFIFTDEEVRMGDPTDTIRRASMMPGQLQDSLVSHRQSLMMGQSGVAANTRSHRLSLMPGHLPSKAASSSQLRSPKGTKRSSSTLYLHQTSPEKKVRASCFPRPLTPKNKNLSSGPSSSQLHPVLSPADRRQSMMFTIDNTPKKNNYLKKGLNKLRSSSTATPAQDSQGGVGRASRAGSFKSPQVTSKGRRKSPQPTSKTGKSPGLTASARKIMRRMKV